MVNSIEDRARQVLITNRESSDRQKRAIALQILADFELFMMFCKIVEAQNRKSKIIQK